MSANVLRIVRRELEQKDEQLAAEWTGLDGLLGAAPPPGRATLRQALRARTADFCRRIRQGEADGGPFREAVLAHVRRTVRDKLLVSNPGWIEPGRNSEA